MRQGMPLVSQEATIVLARRRGANVPVHTVGRPTQELAGDQPKNWRAGQASHQRRGVARLRIELTLVGHL